MSKTIQNRTKSRVKRLSFRIGRSRQLTLTFRRFRTRPANRSKRIQQRVLSIPLSGYKEVAIVSVRRKRNRRNNFVLRRFANFSTAAIALGLTGIVYFGLNLHTPANIKVANTPLVDAAPVQNEPPKTMPRSVPSSLRIPNIDLTTSVVPTGLDSNGAIAMPDGFDITGWYTNSPTPGELGPSIIVGHLDSIYGIAVFWRLRELQPGDIVYVDRQDGTTATFKVDAIQQYPQDSFPTSTVYGNIDHAGLRLITCGGTFNTTTHHYSDNTVVYASLQ